RGWSSGGLLRGLRETPDAGVAGVEPADLGLGPEDQGVEQDQERGIEPGIRLGLAARVGLELLDGGPPLALEERGDVDIARGSGEQDLDGQLVAGRGLGDDRVV